jgi:hypothetical protein
MDTEIVVGVATENELTVTLKGKADAIVRVLVGGLPHDALMCLNQAVNAELRARQLRAEASDVTT